MSNNKHLNQSAETPTTDQTKHDGNIVAGGNACHLAEPDGFRLLEQIDCYLLNDGLELALNTGSHFESRAEAETVCRACRESGHGDFDITRRLDRECTKFVRDTYVDAVSELGLVPNDNHFIWGVTAWKPYLSLHDLKLLAKSVIGDHLLSAIDAGGIKLRIVERAQQPRHETFARLSEHVDSGALPKALIYADRIGSRHAIQYLDSVSAGTDPYEVYTSVLLRLDMLCEAYVLKEVHVALKASGINPGKGGVHIDAVKWEPKITLEALRRYAGRWTAHVMAQLK